VAKASARYLGQAQVHATQALAAGGDISSFVTDLLVIPA
jgi:hypothetical protein